MKSYIHICIFVLFLAVAATHTTFTYAAQPTPLTTEDSSADTTEELKKRIEKAVEEKREQIKGALQGIAADEKGFIGEIQRVTDEAITIKSSDKTTIIPVTSAIQLKRKNVTIKIDDVAVGNWAIIIGKESATGEFAPEQVLVSTETLQPKPQTIVIGNITTITAKEISVTSRLNGQKYTFAVTKNSSTENNDGTALPIKNFEKDIQVLIVGINNDTTTELKTMRALAPIE